MLSAAQLPSRKAEKMLSQSSCAGVVVDDHVTKEPQTFAPQSVPHGKCTYSGFLVPPFFFFGGCGSGVGVELRVLHLLGRCPTI
jgi:hypothetical protein